MSEFDQDDGRKTQAANDDVSFEKRYGVASSRPGSCGAVQCLNRRKNTPWQ
jgi:hypothetical protein